MARNHNGMPDPEPVWLALAILIVAIAMTLGPTRRVRFIATLDALAHDQTARRRVVSITTQNGRRRAMNRHVQVAARFLTRIVVELRGAFR